MELSIKKPTLVIDTEIVIANILRMKDKAVKNDCILRPHFKTHQSAKVGSFFKAQDIHQCTVSSIQMAHYFAEHGWKDITIAFPVNILEIDSLISLSKKAKVNVCVESPEAMQFLLNYKALSIGFFIKIDAGYHRTGIDAMNISLITDIIKLSETNSEITFKGFLQHAGHTYHVKDSSEVNSIHEETIQQMKRLRERFIAQYPDLTLSVGDTPSCSICEDFSEVDEIRPGNFVFYDLMQHYIGACQLSDIAVRLACPVVAKHPDRNEVIIYGGAVHFSKDQVNDPQGIRSFGLVGNKSENWNELLEGTYIKKLSQEHGTIHCPDILMDKIKVGDLLYCIPVHSCLTADLMFEYIDKEGNVYEKMNFNSFS